MTVLILSACNNKTRGLIGNIMYKISKNVYIGNLSTRVRNSIVNVLKDHMCSALVVYDTGGNEQGFSVITVGSEEKHNYNGLWLPSHRG